VRTADDDDEEPRERRPRIRDLAMMTGADLLKQKLAEQDAIRAGKRWAETHALGERTDDPFRSGDRVIHATLGRGKVLGLSGPEGDRRIVIEFDQGGQKELLLAFAGGKLSREAQA
jgi:hypothetical protein